MKKIIVLSQAPLTPQIKSNSYIDEYFCAGFLVEFWDISQYLHPGMKYNDILKENYVKYITSLFDLEASLFSIDTSNAIFILDFSEFWNNRLIFKLMSKYDCYYIRIDMYANTSLDIGFTQKMSKLFSENFFNILLTKLGLVFYQIYKKKHKIYPFQKYYSSSSLVNRTDKINHPDYEKYMFSEKENIIGSKYIVFVDTYFGYHPDAIYIHKANTSKYVVDYEKSLCKYFAFLEEKHGFPVVIAAHPKAHYNNDAFGGRSVIKYETKNLISCAEFVLLQLCNTVSYVLLADKPVIFITTNGYNKVPYLRRGLNNLTGLLKENIYNIDKIDFSKIEFSKVDSNIRNKYIYTYLTDTTIENKKNIDILKQSFLTI